MRRGRGETRAEGRIGAGAQRVGQGVAEGGAERRGAGTGGLGYGWRSGGRGRARWVRGGHCWFGGWLDESWWWLEFWLKGGIKEWCLFWLFGDARQARALLGTRGPSRLQK